MEEERRERTREIREEKVNIYPSEEDQINPRITDLIHNRQQKEKKKLEEEKKKEREEQKRQEKKKKLIEQLKKEANLSDSESLDSDSDLYDL